MTFLCGVGMVPPGEPDEWPDDYDGVPCCAGSAMFGPSRCTCWHRIYDRDQATHLLRGHKATQVARCEDCAFHLGSPEMVDEYRREELDRLVHAGTPFHCHQGMRRVIEWRHPDGRVVAAEPGDYRPPVEAGTPYRADGTPGLICAGWSRAHTEATT